MASLDSSPEHISSASSCASSWVDPQSIDPSIGFEIVSLPGSPFELLNTYEVSSLSTTRDMSPSSPQAASSSPANVSEWVEQQSLPLLAPTVVVTLPSPNNKSTTLQKTPDSSVAKTSLDSMGLQTSAQKVYDIATLLQLRAATPTQHMELRIHPSALAENVFRYKPKSTSSKTQVKFRHRGLSDISSMTNQTNKSEDEVVFAGREWNNAQKPYREPREPPQGHLAQQNEGFKRFLKQVASPPHNRVTAGGRIVPAVPPAPPPVFNFSSIESTIQQPLSTSAYASSEVNAGTKPNTDAEAIDTKVNRSMLPGNYPANQNVNPTSMGQLGTAQKQDLGNNNHTSSEGLGATQPPEGTQSMYWLTGSGPILVINGLHYQASGNGPRIVLDPLQPGPRVVIPPEHTTVMYSQVATGLQYPPVIQSIPMAKPQMSLTNAVNPYHSYYLQYNDQSSSNDTNQYNSLRARLTELDKHIALHLHKLSAFEHGVLVTQRKELVEQIDFLRINKEKNEHLNSSSVSLAGPYQPHGMPIHQQPGNANYFPFVVNSQGGSGGDSQSMGSAVNNNHGTARVTLKKPSLTSSTFFSPDAPPFVPSKMKEKFDKHGPSTTWGAKHEDKHALVSQTNNTVVSRAPLTEPPIVTDATHGTNHKEGRTASTVRELLGEPLPIVSEEEVEYVNRLGLNPAHGEKLYCATVAEFQEVILRVREQALMFGCKGGQSKDPAFDAEQDIRWAMADHDPVLLPPPNPDHIANPRPWSWNDSAFNVRANKSVPAGTNTNAPSSSTYVASNSWSKSSVRNIPDGFFNIFTHRRVDSWDSDPGVDGLIDVTIPRKHPELGLTAAELAEDAAKGIQYKAKGADAFGPCTPSFNRKGVSNVRNVQSESAIHTPSKSTKKRTPQETHRPYQAYMEDDFSTPTTNRVQVTPKNPTNGSAHKRHSNSNSARKAMEGKKEFDPWGGPINPIYDWGTGELISTGDNAERSRYGLIKTAPYKSVKGTKHDPWAPITDSKARYDQGRDFQEKRGVQKSHDWASTRAPKVNLPSSFQMQNSRPAGYVPPKQGMSYKPNEYYGDFPSSTNLGGSTNFLRGMLKSPNYSAPRLVPSVKSAAVEQKMHFTAEHEAEWEKRAANKENLKTDAPRQMRNANGPSMPSQDARNHKANSSTGSSNLHIQGDLLPRSTRARESLSSSNNRRRESTPQYRGAGNPSPWKEASRYDAAADYQFKSGVAHYHGT